MLSRLRQSFLLFSLIGVVLANSGCFALLLGGAAGAAAAVYIQGVLEKTLERNIKDVHAATLKALKAEDVFISSDELNYADAVVKGEFEDGEKIQVNLHALAEKSTKVKIRVGVFGDEVQSGVVMNAIEKRL